MPNIFFIGDTHFAHGNILTFKRADGAPLRDFASIEEHDEHLVAQWNSVVTASDKVYHLGDVAINKKGLPILDRLNGHKRLIRGNHDIYDTSEYLKYFDEIYGSRVIDNIIFTHIPIHVDSIARFRANVHGHLHSNLVMRTYKESGSILLEDNRYLNVSCEQVNYTPISLDEIKGKLK